MLPSSGIFISQATLDALPPSLRTELLSAVFGPSAGSPPSTSTTQDSDTPELDDDHFAEMSSGQARAFLQGCGPKTRLAVEVIAKSDSRFFQLADIAAALQVAPKDLPGIWTGLTKRTRTVMGDTAAYLIHWSGEAVLDEGGNYADQRAEIREMTYRSFRKALGIA